MKLLTAESVCIGHPDKLCDLISDSILDACLKIDANSRVACEVLATKGQVIIAGEITCSEKIDLKAVAKRAVKKAWYDPKEFKFQVYVQKQSLDIAAGVESALEKREGGIDPYDFLGAGDQGTMYGYATNETEEMLPLPLVLAHRIVKRLDSCRERKLIKGIGSDGKAQVTIEYENGRPVRVKTVVVSVQHSKDKDLEKLKEEIKAKVLWPSFEKFPLDPETEVLINPSGRFTLGGPGADTGVTGRKLMVDTYGGLSLHGGGAVSGKDPTKVDRSASYMARFIAKNLVAGGFCEKCEVALSYAIGKAKPVAVSVNSFGTGKVSDLELSKLVQKSFDLRVAAIIEKLNLRRPIYANTATYGHFNSCLFPWEDYDQSLILRGETSG